MSKHHDSHAYKVTRDGENLSGLIVKGQGHDEAIKISNLTNIRISKSMFIGGEEDCLDIVRGDNIRFKECSFMPSKKTRTLCTIKGGATNVSLSGCHFDTEKKTRFPWHISVGDFTIYENDKETRPKHLTQVHISKATYSGKKPIVLVFKGVVYADKTVRVIQIPAFIVGIYFQLNRWFGDKRKPQKS